MALADWSWTAQGGIPGLGFAPGLVVVPHYDEIRRMEWQDRLDSVAPPGFGYLGLDERTGVISDDGTAGGSPARARRTGSRPARRSRSSPGTAERIDLPS